MGKNSQHIQFCKVPPSLLSVHNIALNTGVMEPNDFTSHHIITEKNRMDKSGWGEFRVLGGALGRGKAEERMWGPVEA